MPTCASVEPGGLMSNTGTTIWIDCLDRLEIDGDGVRLHLRSDDASVKLRMSRHQLQKFVAHADIALREQAAIDRNKVVGMRK